MKYNFPNALRLNALLGCLTLAALPVTAGDDISRVWVEFAAGHPAEAEAALNRAGAEFHYRFEEYNAFAVSIPTVAIPGLERNPNIVLIEEDVKRYPLGQTIPWGIDAVQARGVWDSDPADGNIDSGAPTGSGRMVCIIDSGLQLSHSDFSGVSVIGGYNSTGTTSWDQDTCGHGTHVAGTVAAANNSEGVVGVSPGTASLFIVKVFDGASCGWAYSSTLVDAANRCRDAGANIINMSLGGGAKSRTEDRAFNDLATKNDILSIAAAGNDGNSVKSYPASYNSVVSVAAVDSNRNVASFSQYNSSVELAAPGVGVLSTVPWSATNTLAVGGTTYEGGHIENAASTATSGIAGQLVDGGLCDSTGSWSGKIVLCARGSISFYDKVMHVQRGGGVGTAIYNNASGNFAGTLGDGNSSTIPAISLSQADGQALKSGSLGQTATLTSLLDTINGGYEAWDGTSMATPHVSGVAALVWSGSPASSSAEIRSALQSTALDLGATGKDTYYGYGLVQAQTALNSLTGGGGTGNPAPVTSFTYSCTNKTCSFDATDSSDSDGIASYAWTFGDGATGSGVTASHTYVNYGNFIVSLTVTDTLGASSTSTQTVQLVDPDGAGDSTGPVISNVSSESTKGTSFDISWTTDEPATSMVTFTCCGAYNNSNLVTFHSMGFRGSKGVLYEYYVSSSDAAGNLTTAGPFQHQN